MLLQPRPPRLFSTSTSTPSTEEIGAWLTLEELWNKLVYRDLEERKRKYEKKADTKFLATIKPVVERLLAFSQGVSSLTKANKVLPLVWGSTQIFLESAKNTYNFSSNIQALLHGLETTLPRLNDYVALYPGNVRLRRIVHDVCAVYVEACILTVLYLRRRAWKNLLRGVYLACHDGRHFADAMDKLEKHERALHYEADLASARHTKDIHAAHFDKIQDIMGAEAIAGSPDEIVQRLDKARDEIAEILKVNHIVGLASHVIFKGEIIWTANMGYRDMSDKKLVDSDTMFPIGALSQGFTAACVAQQVYRKALSYDDKVSTLLPQVRASDATGLNDKTIIPAYNNLGPRAALRSQFLHNSMGYGLLAKIVSPEYANYLRENVLKPLRMARTELTLNELSDEKMNTSRRYSVGVNGRLFEHLRVTCDSLWERNPTPSAAVGSMRSTTNDLAKYCIALNQAWKRQRHTKDVKIRSLGREQVFPNVDLLFGPLQAMDEKANKSHAAGWATCTLPAAIGDIGANPELMEMPILGAGGAPATVIWNQSRYHGTHGFVALLPEYEAAVIVLSNTTTGNDAPDWIGQLLIQATLGNPYKNNYLFLAEMSALSARQKYYQLADKIEQGRQTKGPERPLRDYCGRYKSAISDESIQVWKRPFLERLMGREERDEDEGGQGRKKSPLILYLPNGSPPLHHHHGDTFTWFQSWNQLAKQQAPLVRDPRYYTIQFQPNKSGTLIESLIWFSDPAKSEGEVFAHVLPPTEGV
ncbi:beta-lactamase/transpeptidase-like protein [Trichoderma velutinum]